MKLEGKLVQPEKVGMFNLKPKLATPNQIKLYLTLQFNEHEEQLPKSRIHFGLKGGTLKLKLENGKIDLASSALNGSFKLCRQPEQPNQESNDYQSCVTVSLRERKPEVNANLNTHQSAGTTKQSSFSQPQVSAQGFEENPTWVFVGEKDQPVLKGLLKPTLLGTLKVTAKPCRVEATFCVAPQDIYISHTEGLLPQTTSKKKQVVIEQAIARRLFKGKLRPYVSRQELRYD